MASNLIIFEIHSVIQILYTYVLTKIIIGTVILKNLLITKLLCILCPEYITFAVFGYPSGIWAINATQPHFIFDLLTLVCTYTFIIDTMLRISKIIVGSSTISNRLIIPISNRNT